MNGTRWIAGAVAALALNGLVSAADGQAASSAVEVVRLEDQPWYEAEDRAVAREVASPRNSSARAMSIADIIIPAGVEVRPHHHVMEEVYFVESGEGVMMVEDERRVIRAGDAVVIPPHAWHNVRNATDQELRLTVTCAPAWAPELLEFDRASQPGPAAE